MTSAFCGSCGAAVTTPFCPTCGKPTVLPGAGAVDPVEAVGAVEDDRTVVRPPEFPVAPVAPAPVAPAAPAPPPYVPPGQPMAPPPMMPPPAVPPSRPPSAPPSPTPVVNPFASWQVRDIAADLGAVLLLFISLNLPWDYGRGGERGVHEINDQWWVILSLLVSMASLVLPYLGASRAIPALTPAMVRLIKLACLVPVLACLVHLVVLELVHLDDPVQGGIGTGAAMLVLGALLAAQPRAYDDIAGGERMWQGARTATLVAGVALMLVTWAVEMVRFVLSDPVADGWLGGTGVALLCGASVLYLAIPFGSIGMLAIGGRRAWELLLVAGVATYLFVAVVGRGSGGGSATTFDGGGGTPAFHSVNVEKLSRDPDTSFLFIPEAAGTFLLAAAAALMLGRWRRQVAAPDQATRATEWLGVGRAAAGFGSIALGVLLAYWTVAVVLSATQNNTDPDASTIVEMVLVLAMAALGGIAAAALGRPTGRFLAVCLAVTWFVLGVILVSVMAGAEASGGWGATTTSTPTETFLCLTLPIVLLLAVTAPPSLRRTFGPLLPQSWTNPQPPHAHGFTR